MKLHLLSLSFLAAVTALNPISGTSQEMKYPKSPKVEQIDEFWGNKIDDPYRWLEGDATRDDDVKNWVAAQNELTFGYLKKLPYRDEIESRLTKLWNYEKYGAPFKEGDHYYFFKNDGLQNQSVLYQMDSLDGEPSVLLDPNSWSENGTKALGGMAFSEDGKYLAYGLADAGSDWRTWYVMDIESRKILADKIEWVKFGGATWSSDSKGFYYNRYDEPKKGEEFTSLNLNQKVYYHEIGLAQSEDELIHADPENPEWGFSPEVSEDGRYLVITVWKGTDDRYQVMYKDLTKPDTQLVKLISNFENDYTFIGNEGEVMYFKSDYQAPKKCVIAIDPNRPDKANWKVIIPESENALESVGMVGDFIVADYLKDAVTQIKLFDLAGNFVREVEFPGIGTASGFGGKRNNNETFYSFSSFNQPPTIFRYDLGTGESKLFRTAQVDFDPDNFVVKQVFYQSKDGTKVPMFIAHKKGLELDGQNPTLLYGYGGFNISLTPSFSISRLQWMEMGGIFAMPNLRGGGEYGKEWHKAGTKTQKQNVFNDFIAAAEFLIENKYTSSANLGIQGGSNGGLLVGACMTQRPDLYNACLPAVGVMDMLRFHEFTAGRFWTDDYGCAEESASEFEALYAYSPYHNIKDETAYPPTLVTTADHDDRVVPGHSFKFAARLQEAQAGSNPTLIRIETDAGHGAGKPTAKIIEEAADQWAFLAKHLSLKPDFPQADQE